MSEPLVSICIPTYNRAPKLRTLLEQLAAERAVRDGEVAILVADNCSEDETQDVLAELSGALPLRIHRQQRNLGADRNIRWCLESVAETEYVWCFCDDDLPEEGAIDEVLRLLGEYDPDWLHLPHRWRGPTGSVVHASLCPEAYELYQGSPALFRRYHHWLAFMTASVHRRERLQPVVASWSTENGYNPLLWGFVSHLQGTCLVADRPLILAGGEVSWDSERVLFSTEHYVAMYEHGLRLGLSAAEFAAALDELYQSGEYLDYWRQAPAEALAGALAAFPHSRRLRTFASTIGAEQGRRDWFRLVDEAAHVSGAGQEARELTTRGESAFAAGDLHTALACFKQALDRHPTRAETWNDLGVVLHALGDPKSAIAAFSTALTFAPEYTDARENRAALAAAA